MLAGVSLRSGELLPCENGPRSVSATASQTPDRTAKSTEVWENAKRCAKIPKQHDVVTKADGSTIKNQSP